MANKSEDCKAKGDELVENGNFEAAIENYTQALESDPGSAEAYFKRAGCKRNMGKLEEAIADFDKVVEIAPDIPIAYLNRGSVKNALMDNEGALADYNQVIDLIVNDCLLKGIVSWKA